MLKGIFKILSSNTSIFSRPPAFYTTETGSVLAICVHRIGKAILKMESQNFLDPVLAKPKS